MLDFVSIDNYCCFIWYSVGIRCFRIFAVIIVQTEDAVPSIASSIPDTLPENFSIVTASENVSVNLPVNTDSVTKSDSEASVNSAHIHSSFEDVSSNINKFDHTVDVDSASQNSGALNE